MRCAGPRRSRRAFQFPFLDLDRARNWKEFTAALARFPGPGQNFVYADVDGNIGYHATGRLPIRPANCGGDVPADGASGDCEWQGFIPFDDLPQFFNPASRHDRHGESESVSGGLSISGDRQFRAARIARDEIRTLLERRAKWQPQEMLEVQKDVYSAFSRFPRQADRGGVGCEARRRIRSVREAVDSAARLERANGKGNGRADGGRR